MTYLEEIVGSTQRRVARKKQRVAYDELEMAAKRLEPPEARFSQAIAAPPISLIAEFKRRSPSAGEITSRDPADVATDYQRAGAAALSVLCEPDHFGGSFDDFAAVREAVDLPLLVKDFIIEAYQVVEARVHGAHAILLIAAALPGSQLGELVDLSISQGLDPLVEVHDISELKRALETRTSMIGINQRDLRTFEVDTRLAVDLSGSVSSGRAVVAESGITSRAQVVALEDAGVDAVLVGESLLRAEDQAGAVKDLLGT